MLFITKVFNKCYVNQTSQLESAFLITRIISNNTTSPTETERIMIGRNQRLGNRPLLTGKGGRQEDQC